MEEKSFQRKQERFMIFSEELKTFWVSYMGNEIPVRDHAINYVINDASNNICLVSSLMTHFFV